ncbi:MAG: hypothetical protein IJ993_03495 [Akkermansia sp.]|nr:hypothetical protein [Akkermansia sp.]
MAHSLQEVQSFDEHLLFYLCCTFGTVVGAKDGKTTYTIQLVVEKIRETDEN